ncbi:hypothetical protein J6590_011633 [Homalodisca vitripennis]|nr:hypothetical protein J6590_011633 [Homalodisca vitripennis]
MPCEVWNCYIIITRTEETKSRKKLSTDLIPSLCDEIVKFRVRCGTATYSSHKDRGEKKIENKLSTDLNPSLCDEISRCRVRCRVRCRTAIFQSQGRGKPN